LISVNLRRDTAQGQLSKELTRSTGRESGQLPVS
jgi:hypothetical protein